MLGELALLALIAERSTGRRRGKVVGTLQHANIHAGGSVSISRQFRHVLSSVVAAGFINNVLPSNTFRDTTALAGNDAGESQLWLPGLS